MNCLASPPRVIPRRWPLGSSTGVIFAMLGTMGGQPFFRPLAKKFRASDGHPEFPTLTILVGPNRSFVLRDEIGVVGYGLLVVDGKTVAFHTGGDVWHTSAWA